MSVDNASIFNKLLDEYRSNYVQFVTTGTEAYRTAYTRARDAIHDMLGQTQEVVDKERRDLQHFAGGYQQDNADLGQLHDKASGMSRNAQAIQDKYETAQERYDAWLNGGGSAKPVVDITNGYGLLWRFGALMVLLVLVFLIGYYNPTGGVYRPAPYYGNPFAGFFPSAVPGTPGTPQMGSPASFMSSPAPRRGLFSSP